MIAVAYEMVSGFRTHQNDEAVPDDENSGADGPTKLASDLKIPFG